MIGLYNLIKSGRRHITELRGTPIFDRITIHGDNIILWPLLLTQVNFNPSMDKNLDLSFEI